MQLPSGNIWSQVQGPGKSGRLGSGSVRRRGNALIIDLELLVPGIEALGRLTLTLPDPPRLSGLRCLILNQVAFPTFGRQPTVQEEAAVRLEILHLVVEDLGSNLINDEN